MSATKTLSIFSIILLLIISTLSATALQENFDVQSTQAFAACSYAVTTNTIQVINTGDVESSYSVSATGDASSFVTYSDASFSVKPGQSKTIYVYLAPGSRTGSYDIETTITATFGMSKTISQSIDVNNCANMHVDVKTPVVKAQPCAVSQFSFNVKNAGQFAENYVFNVKGLEAYTTLSAPSLFLAPGEAKQVDVFVNPECGIYGEKELTFQSYAETSQYLAEARVYLDIAQAYDYEVKILPSVLICNDKKTVIPFTIENKVSFTNQYEMKISGADWLTAEADVVELGPYGKGTTALIMQPSNPGTYYADVAATSLRGDVVKAGPLEIVVDGCYDADVNVEAPADILVQGKTKTYAVTIKNEGTKQDTYEFALDAPAWITANAVKATLKSGESKTFTLTAKANETGSFKATFIAISNETGNTISDVLKLNVISLEEAHALDISQSHTRVLYGENFISIKLENKGVLPTTYDLKLNAPAWIKLPANSITLQPGEKAELIVNTATKEKDEQGDYEVELVATVKGEDIGFATTFSVKLRTLTVTQTLVQYAIAYWIVLVAIAVLLVILLFIKIFGGRIARRYRSWKIRRQEAAKLAKELKARKAEEKKAAKLLKQSLKQEKKGSFWKTFWTVVLVLFVLSGIAAGVFVSLGYAPFVTEYFKQKEQAAQQFEPIIQVDTSKLEAYGNTVIVRGEEVVIPVVVKNNYDDDLVFDITVDAPWIKTDVKSIELNGHDSETFKLRVTPDIAEKGLYKIGVSATLEKENKRFTEDITLNVRKKSLMQEFLNYLPYLIGGLVALGLILFFGKKYKKAPKAEKKEEKIVYKPVRKVSIDIPSRK